jgi:hypothetical protein
MSAHWRLALRYAVWVSVGAVLVGMVIWPLYGGAHAAALLYGVGMGLVSFVSTALTVSLLTGRSTAVGVMIGAATFAGRCGFAATVLGIAAYLDLWPVVPMLVGFAGVYLAENIALLPAVPKKMSTLGAEHDVGNPVREEAERRVGV